MFWTNVSSNLHLDRIVCTIVLLHLCLLFVLSFVTFVMPITTVQITPVMENLTINQRIIEVIKFLDASPTVFADEIGIQRSGLSHIIKGRNRPSLDVIQKIVARYPDINLGWLVNGTGNISNTTPSVINLRQKKQQDRTTDSQHEDSLKNTLFDTGKEDDTPLPAKGTALSTEKPRTEAKRVFSPQDFEVAPNDHPFENEKAENPPYSAGENTRSTAGLPKKIAKILVFYTDNTFEEFLK